MFKNILLPVDLEEEKGSAKALSVALDLCKDHNAKLHVLAVVPGFSMSMVSQYFPKDFEEKTIADTVKRLKAHVVKNVPSDIKAKAIVANGNVYEEILHTADEINCDLVVITAHRPDLKDFLLGPNAARVVRHAKCSVLVVRE